MRREDTDPTRVQFRSVSRLFRMNGKWFFASREGDKGPYHSETDAQIELNYHVDATRTLTGPQVAKHAGKGVGYGSSASVDVPVLKLVPKDGHSVAGRRPRHEGTMQDILTMENTSMPAYRQRVLKKGA